MLSVLLIDNYDSFTYNLYQQISEVIPDSKVTVKRNDTISLQDITDNPPAAVVVSPGPGRPEDTGRSIEILNWIAGTVPVLGVCLGHQLLASLFGAKIVKAKEVKHGKTSMITHTGKHLFKNMPNPFAAARYHSLAVEQASCPGELEIDAVSDDGEIMAISCPKMRMWGVQFHPESFLTESGGIIMTNFIKTCHFNEDTVAFTP